MEFTAYTLLTYVVGAIFLFCYFVATRVWVKVDEINRNSPKKEAKEH